MQWLKKLESWEEDQSDIFKIGEDKFRLIKSDSESVERGNNEYVNTLTISEVKESDAGMYYCFVRNIIGYRYKNAYLTVLSRKFIIINHPTCIIANKFCFNIFRENSSQFQLYIIVIFVVY